MAFKILPRQQRRSHSHAGRYTLDPATLAAYVFQRYGPGWQPGRTVGLASTGTPLLMQDFRPGVGCCTITALTAVFAYWRRARGLQSIPADPKDLFTQIEQVAVRFGYSRKRGRTNPFLLRWIVGCAWRCLGYAGRCRSRYFIRLRDLIGEIDNGRPALLNIAWHDYHAHSIVLTGYETWVHGQHLDGKSLLFLQVHDGWSAAPRLIDYQAMARLGSRGFTPFSLTRILPPPGLIFPD